MRPMHDRPRLDGDQLLALVPALRRYARALLRDAWAADDLVQDTLERAWHRQTQFALDSDLRAWTFTIMHNLFIGQKRRQDPLSRSDGDAALDEHPAPSSDPLLAQDILRLVDRLPDEQRAVLLLVSVEEFSYAQAAQALGVPIGTVMSRLARARERLRGWIGDTSPAQRISTGALRIVK